MRNVILALVFMLVGTFAFAANDVENVLIIDDVFVELNNSVELANADFVDQSLSSEFENYVESITPSEADCSGITVTLGGGDSFVWTGSCAGLWRLIRSYLA